ncbi:MAG: glycosyltransferase [Deltaproteobacteria bacterium]|nr:glycosyltransferase [Deltaproteobacteria bacterium]
MEFAWKTLPRNLALPLLKGSVGKARLCALAQSALEISNTPGSPGLRLGADMLRAAWEYDPLDHDLALNLLRAHAVQPCLSRPLEKMAELFAKASRFPDNADELLAQLGGRDTGAMWRYLKRMRRKDGNNLFWTRQALLVAFTEGSLAELEEWLESCALPRPLRESIAADIAFAREDYADAARGYASAHHALPVPLWRERLAESLCRIGEREAALAHWRDLYAARPWHSNLVLRLSDALQGRDAPGDLPPGRGAVLLYSWNKAEVLHMALQALAASELGDALVAVLDNGSSDGTPALLRSWRERLGERMLLVTLPCNIGAPPARNWLLSLPETRDCDWVAFLDDDAIVPPDWLRYFGRAMRAFPSGAVYGCRVVDHKNLSSLQSVDLHLEAGGPAGGQGSLEPAHERRFSISDLHYQVQDFGQFCYMRPCVSVTGCCHLFRRAALDAAGHFDLRFAPTQYDDVEHDIRHALRGELPVYQGHLRVAHMQRTGQDAWADPDRLLATWANLFKLQVKHTRVEYDAIREADHQSLLADMQKRVEELEG